MIYELWDKKFNIKKLREHLVKHVFPLEPTFQSPAFGGWSVLSSDGTYQDGWHKGHLKNCNVSKRTLDFNVPTEICHGYLKEVIDDIATEGMLPCRARIIQLAAGQSSVWHCDGSPDQYAVRLHIPLITNEACLFETETESAHLPADGSAYFLWVNRLHRVINAGRENRYHLVINIYDKVGVTKFHKYYDFLNRAPALST